MTRVVDYLDYRTYLKDWYTQSKARNRKVSFRWLAAKAGFASPSFAKLVMEGKRNLGPDGVAGLAKALGLQGADLSYWNHLVAFNQETTSVAKQSHYAVLSEIVGSIQADVLGSEATRYYSSWYLPVLRELAPSLEPDTDPGTLGQRLVPPLTPEQAKDGLASLLEMGLLERRTDGRLAQTSRSITSGTPEDRAALIRFHKTMLSHSAVCLESLPREDRHVSAMTLGVSAETCKSILVEFEGFRERVLRLVHADRRSDRVVHLGFQLVPVAGPPFAAKAR
jgi:uncharacterized protein (TIGR02147 family)